MLPASLAQEGLLHSVLQIKLAHRRGHRAQEKRAQKKRAQEKRAQEKRAQEKRSQEKRSKGAIESRSAGGWERKQRYL
jgi:hypothetical protein